MARLLKSQTTTWSQRTTGERKYKKKKALYELKTLYEFLLSEHENIHTIPPKELQQIAVKIVLGVRKKNGEQNYDIILVSLFVIIKQSTHIYILLHPLVNFFFQFKDKLHMFAPTCKIFYLLNKCYIKFNTRFFKRTTL